MTHHKKRRTVEDCYAISISQVAGFINLRDPQPITASLRSRVPKSGKMTPVHCKIKLGDGGTLLLSLSYAVKDRWRLEHPVEESIPLLTTKPHFGGVRWWLSCPSATNGKRCGRRVGKLYRAPGGWRFACRHCLDLTYQSSQRSHRYDRLCRLVAGGASGEVFRAVKVAYNLQKKGTTGRGTGATPKLSEAFDRVFYGVKER